jgi:hypothetical protein
MPESAPPPLEVCRRGRAFGFILPLLKEPAAARGVTGITFRAEFGARTGEFASAASPAGPFSERCRVDSIRE